MKTEPEWKDNLGTEECPVPADHVVQVMFRNGNISSQSSPERFAGQFRWNHLQAEGDIIAFRDWTAWEEQLKAEEPTTSWNGEGLPPVGTVCEMIDDVGKWVVVEIFSHFGGSCFGWSSKRSLYYFTNNSKEFRKIPNEEQLAINEPAPAWNGEGLPPAGTICLAKLRSGTWYKVRILLTNPEIYSCVAVLIHSDGTYDQVHWLQKFKLLPSEEDQAVHYMLEKVSECASS